jgi:hypothetical protein
MRHSKFIEDWTACKRRLHELDIRLSRQENALKSNRQPGGSITMIATEAVQAIVNHAQGLVKRGDLDRAARMLALAADARRGALDARRREIRKLLALFDKDPDMGAEPDGFDLWLELHALDVKSQLIQRHLAEAASLPVGPVDNGPWDRMVRDLKADLARAGREEWLLDEAETVEVVEAEEDV